jgi:hypothetical protein
MPIVTARCPRQRKPFTGACAGLNRKAVCARAQRPLPILGACSGEVRGTMGETGATPFPLEMH